MILSSVVGRFTDVFASLFGPVVSLHDVTDSGGTGIWASASVELYDRRCGHLDTTPVLSCLSFARSMELCISGCIINSPRIIL